jgi:hypothetical protein
MELPGPFVQALQDIPRGGMANTIDSMLLAEEDFHGNMNDNAPSSNSQI